MFAKQNMHYLFYTVVVFLLMKNKLRVFEKLLILYKFSFLFQIKKEKYEPISGESEIF